jgi:hypothetical protein
MCKVDESRRQRPEGKPMQVIELRLTDVCLDDALDITFPRHPQRAAELERKFPGLPLLIVDQGLRLVWGHEYMRCLLDRGEDHAWGLKMDVAADQALLLNFNLSNRMFGLNLYEKLLFVKKISRYLKPDEIQRQADLGFALNDELLQQLDRLLHVSSRRLLAAGQLCLKAALRVAAFPARDRRALLKLFSQVRLSESQQLLAAQMLRESAFREKKPLVNLLRALPLDALLAQEMPQQRIMAEIRRQRFPELTRCEAEWRQWEKKRSVPGRLTLAHVPLFAGKEIQISLTVKNRLEADKLLEKLK